MQRCEKMWLMVVNDDLIEYQGIDCRFDPLSRSSRVAILGCMHNSR